MLIFYPKYDSRQGAECFRQLKSPAAARWAVGAIICSLLAIFLLTDPDPVGAQLSGLDINDVVTKYPEIPWKLGADEISYDQNTDQYIARGNVTMTKIDKKLTADYVRFDHATMSAYAWGNVVLISGQDVIKASSLFLDLTNQVGTIQDGSIFLKENNFHIAGERIQKTGQDTYKISKGTITTCDGNRPDWKITGEDLEVNIEGYGTAKDATLFAKDVPVLYTPYMVYPARRQRHTGLLVPEFGLSERKGTQFNQPFFWAISDSQDATFYGYYMNKRGLKPGAEYRYVLSERAKGAIMFDGLHDEKTDDGGESSADYGFEDAGTQYLRTNQNRWWFRMSHHQDIPWNFKAKLDVDLVSDQDYLREFTGGYMGFRDSDRYFEKYFNRALDDVNDPIRLNRLNLNRIWPSWSLNAEMRYFYDTTQRNSDLPDSTISRLPVINLRSSRQKILTSPFYYNLNSSYNYFWRPSGLTGQRMDIYPRIFYPYRFMNYFTFEPSAGVRETLYYLDNPDSSDNPDTDNWENRELFDLRFNLFSEIYKVFDISGEALDKIKHTLRPQILYRYVPDVDQGDLPKFDSIDRIDNTSLITYSLTNTLTSKSRKGPRSPVPSEEEETKEEAFSDPPDNKYIRGGAIDDQSNYRYHDFLRFQLEQSYDTMRSKQPFSPISAKIDFFPGKYLNFDAGAGWSVYDNKLVYRNIAATVWDGRGDRLYIDYRYDSYDEVDNEISAEFEKTESISANLKIQVTPRFSLFGDYERNLVDDIDIRKSIGFFYQASCWSFNFRYVDKTSDAAFDFRIELSGLGGIGF